MTHDRLAIVALTSLAIVAVTVAYLASDAGEGATAPPGPTFAAATQGAHDGGLASITCDPQDFVHTQLPTMTDVVMTVRIGGVTRRALAQLGTRTWDGAETAVYNAAMPADPSGLFQVVEPRGPVALACVRYESVRTR